METIILVVTTFTVASLGCERCPFMSTLWVWPTAVAVAGGRGLPPHVEHHSHHTVVSRGAGESLSSAPTGIKPGTENWDLTVRAMTSCSCPPPPPPLHHHSGSHWLRGLWEHCSFERSSLRVWNSPSLHLKSYLDYLHAPLIPQGSNLILLP